MCLLDVLLEKFKTMFTCLVVGQMVTSSYSADIMTTSSGTDIGGQHNGPAIMRCIMITTVELQVCGSELFVTAQAHTDRLS